MMEGDLEEKSVDSSQQKESRSIKHGAGNWAAAKKLRGQPLNKQKPQPPSEPSVIIWQEYFSEDGETYYYNPESQESRWEYPTGDNVQVVSQYQDDEGYYYWYNFVTGESTWA